MKLKFKGINSAFLGAIFSLAVLMLGFQNCSDAKFGIDPSAKDQTLSTSNVLGGNDGSIPAPTSGSNPSSNDGNIGSPTPSGNDGNNSGSTPSWTPNFNSPQNTGNSVGSVPFGSSGNTINFSRMCTFGDGSHSPKMLWDNTSEVKLLITATDNTTVLCEVDNIRQQIINKKPVDISSCTNLPMGSPLFVVDMNVTSDYADNDIAFMTMYSSFMLPVDINYTTSGDSTNAKSCDGDDPLLVQLNTTVPQTIQLTAPQDGVMFDLLGQMIQPAHSKVLTSWFARSDTENYFLVLPDANGQVLGIDQMFGNSTLGPDLRYAPQGFAALAKYDENRDGLISAEDAVFSQLRLWKDANRDGIAQPEELFSLDAKGIVAIDLQFDSRYQEQDAYGNMVKYKSVVKMKDNSYGLIYDLWLKYIVK